MPRRPRPAHRSSVTDVRVQNNKLDRPTQVLVAKKGIEPKGVAVDEGLDMGPDDEDDMENGDESEASACGEGSTRSSQSFEVEENDADAPRVVQWEDGDKFDLEGEEEEEVDAAGEENKAGPPSLESLQSNLSGLPFGALRRVLNRAEVVSESDNDSDSEKDVDKKPEKGRKVKPIEKVEWSIKRRTDIAKRSSKHAPTEVTSKRPVTRARTVVDVPKLVPRDPRFLPTTGEFSAVKFQQSYGFLADSHKSELQTLRDNLKRARKLLENSPHGLYEERQKEVNRLEQAMKRIESLVNRDRRERVDQEALRKVTKEEREKRAKGKGGWWMKESEKRTLLMRARYEALAAEGGKGAVKKAIEKKQKKISQREKRSRPYPKGGASDSGWVGREERDAKCRRVK